MLTTLQVSRKSSHLLQISPAKTSRRTSSVWILHKEPSTVYTSTFTSHLTGPNSTQSWFVRARSWVAAHLDSSKPTTKVNNELDEFPFLIFRGHELASSGMYCLRWI